MTGPLLAVETGGTKIVARIVIGEAASEERWTTRSPMEAADAIAAFVHARVPAGRLAAAGMASFGPLILSGPQRGRMLATAKPGWTGSNLAEDLARRLDVEVGVDTDVNAAALAERMIGAAAGSNSAAYVTIGTGIGAGFATDAGTLKGALHPEVGHLRLARAPTDEMPSACPFHHDCAEGLASGAAIAKRLRGARSLADAPDVLDLCGRYVAQLLAATVLAWSPHKIILGGGVGASSGFLQAVRHAFADELGSYGVGEAAHAPDFITPPTFADAGLEGALLIARDMAARARG